MIDEITKPPQSAGYMNIEEALKFNRHPEEFIADLTMNGLNYIISTMLDLRYPADIFGKASQVYPSWSSEHGGEDIDPGVRWVVLLRAALEQLPEKDRG